MNQQEWLSAVALKLKRSGLPKCYVSRTCGELADHAEQCRMAGREFTAFDDSPDELCQSLVINYRRRSLIGRLPPVFCLVVPAAIALTVPLGYFVGVGLLLASVFEGFFENHTVSKVEMLTVSTAFYFGIATVPFISSVAVGWCLRQMARPWHWSLLMFGVLFWATLSVNTTLTYASDGSSLSLACDPSRTCVGSLHHWAQCLIVVVVGLLFVYRQRHPQPVSEYL